MKDANNSNYIDVARNSVHADGDVDYWDNVEHLYNQDDITVYPQCSDTTYRVFGNDRLSMREHPTDGTDDHLVTTTELLRQNDYIRYNNELCTNSVNHCDAFSTFSWESREGDPYREIFIYHIDP